MGKQFPNLVGAVFLVGGCYAPDSDSPGAGSRVIDDLAPVAVDDSSSLLAFAGVSSAAGVWGTVALPIFAVVASSNGCPSTTESADGNQLTVDAGEGCYDEDGKLWSGRLEVDSDLDVRLHGWAKYRFRGLGFTFDGACGSSSLHWTGLAFLRTAQDFYRLSVDLRQDAYELEEDTCTATHEVRGWDYVLEIDDAHDGADNDDVADGSSWSGSGRIGIQSRGSLVAETFDEVDLVDACESEMESGLTRLDGAGHVTTIRYDGATDCDDPPTARWSLDGVDRGEVVGIACSASPGDRHSCGVALAMLSAVVIVLRTRAYTFLAR